VDLRGKGAERTKVAKEGGDGNQSTVWGGEALDKWEKGSGRWLGKGYVWGWRVQMLAFDPKSRHPRMNVREKKWGKNPGEKAKGFHPKGGRGTP